MSLFGGMPFPLQFFLAFIVVLGLIGIAAWLVRRLGAGRLGGVGMRGRQPRLAVVDYASVDGRRRLILVRRDNVEHLVMIGGPSDIVVESNIVRALPATREVPVARPPTMVEPPPPRAIPIPAPEPVMNGVWPLQDEPAVPAAAPRAPRNEPVSEEPAAWPLQPQAEAQPRAPRDTLAALADELSTRPAVPQRARPQAYRPQPPEQRPEIRAEPRQEPRQELRQEPRAEPRQEACSGTARCRRPARTLRMLRSRLTAASPKWHSSLRPPCASRPRRSNAVNRARRRCRAPRLPANPRHRRQRRPLPPQHQMARHRAMRARPR